VLVARPHGREVGEDLVEQLRVGSSGQRRLLGAPQFDAATNCMARVICLMFRDAVMRLRRSCWLGTLLLSPCYARNVWRKSFAAASRAAAVSSSRTLVVASFFMTPACSVSRKRSNCVSKSRTAPRRYVVEEALGGHVEDRHLALERHGFVLAAA